MARPIVVVTGAAKAGIGEAVTRQLLSEGFSVIGTYTKRCCNGVEA